MARFDNILGIHEQALALRSQRIDLLSQNIANAQTPGFKARDLDFKAVLSAATGDALQTTHHQHFAVGEDQNRDGMVYRVPMNSSADGNTVESSVEQAQFGAAAAQYQATLDFLNNRVSGLRRALRGE
jgi:flagellar basal-body rod protein FlgB